tara:strand:+ start:900 stop:1025 length:126 start_codon:yes stop_codon:yes gene_type:complete
MTLLAGDVIVCGTSLGIGSIEPDGFIDIGNEGIGVFRNSVD